MQTASVPDMRVQVQSVLPAGRGISAHRSAVQDLAFSQGPSSPPPGPALQGQHLASGRCALLHPAAPPASCSAQPSFAAHSSCRKHLLQQHMQVLISWSCCCTICVSHIARSCMHMAVSASPCGAGMHFTYVSACIYKAGKHRYASMMTL